MSLAPSKKRKAETTAISLSHHSIPPQSRHHHTTEGHTLHWIQSPSSRPVTVEPQGALELASSAEGRCSWRPLIYSTHRSLSEMKTIEYPISSIVIMMVMDHGVQKFSKKSTNRHEAPIPSCPKHLSVSSLKSWNQKTMPVKSYQSRQLRDATVDFGDWRFLKLQFQWDDRLSHLSGKRIQLSGSWLIRSSRLTVSPHQPDMECTETVTDRWNSLHLKKIAAAEIDGPLWRIG